MAVRNKKEVDRNLPQASDYTVLFGDPGGVYVVILRVDCIINCLNFEMMLVHAKKIQFVLTCETKKGSLRNWRKKLQKVSEWI